MSAHIIVNIDLKGAPEALGPYQGLARETMKTHGIRLLTKGIAEVLEGDPPGNLVVLLEADSVEAAERWYGSAEYKAAIDARKGIADFTMVVIPSV